jgi:sulfur carrier protein ThiS adenylyltransferase
MFTHTVLTELFPRGARLVAASGLAGTGPANDIVTRALKPGFSLVGDNISDVDAIGVMLASRVGVTASHQSHQIIRWVLEDTATE